MNLVQLIASLSSERLKNVFMKISKVCHMKKKLNIFGVQLSPVDLRIGGMKSIPGTRSKLLYSGVKHLVPEPHLLSIVLDFIKYCLRNY